MARQLPVEEEAGGHRGFPPPGPLVLPHLNRGSQGWQQQEDGGLALSDAALPADAFEGSATMDSAGDLSIGARDVLGRRSDPRRPRDRGGRGRAGRGKVGALATRLKDGPPRDDAAAGSFESGFCLTSSLHYGSRSPTAMLLAEPAFSPAAGEAAVGQLMLPSVVGGTGMTMGDGGGSVAGRSTRSFVTRKAMGRSGRAVAGKRLDRHSQSRNAAAAE